jgi:hypothetical protein
MLCAQSKHEKLMKAQGPILTRLRKILGPFVDLVFFEGYILGPKMVGLC